MQDSYSQEHIIYIYICLGSQSLTSVTVAIHGSSDEELAARQAFT